MAEIRYSKSPLSERFWSDLEKIGIHHSQCFFPCIEKLIGISCKRISQK